ncbi:hypothetical protein V1512DRAFT_273776 [Lipomyces arxii]|uniref:uncharacterized protein n=1 Tax=Lipomyces arxii TaxID=56418 RepID=UPI0034CE4786
MADPSRLDNAKQAVIMKRSLYDGITSDAATVVAKAPVTYDVKTEVKDEQDEKQQMLSAALQFQPVRHLQPQAKKAVTVISKPPAIVARPVTKVTLDNFTTEEVHETEYAKAKRQNRGKRRKKKEEAVQAVDWEDVYDPMRPNSYEQYKQSEEKYMEDDDWRTFLVDLQRRQKKGYVSPEPSDENDEVSESEPKHEEDNRQDEEEKQEEADYDDKPQRGLGVPAQFYRDETTTTTVAKAPMLYTQPEMQFENASDILSPRTRDDSPPRTAARQKTKRETFAQRLLSKYGWTPGTGLGATSDGITKALHFSADKSMKGHGKIVDKNERRDDDGKYGKMSKVVVLLGLLEPGQVDEGLAGEIGEECGSKYGQVERVYIHETDDKVNIYVKFTSELSALRAVNGLDGRLFGGKPITTQYFDELDFENGRYKQ